jgi:putative transposase
MVVRKRLQLTGTAMAFVTTTAKNWTPIFSDPRIAMPTLYQLNETLSFYHVSLAAYVLMPSHLHTLLGFRNIVMMSEVIQSFKSLSSKRLRELLPQKEFAVFYNAEKFQLWKPRFDDLIIWSEKQFRIKIEYIHRNPVKAGLVASEVDYSLSSAGDWMGEGKGIIPVDKNWSWTGEEGI